MMGRARFFLMGLALVSLAAAFPSAALGDQGEKKHVRVSEYGEGHAYCPPRNVVIGNMAVQGGRCYKVAVVRNTQGAFLAFLDPAVRIPVGRLENLNSDEGRGIKGHIIFLVPLPMTSQLVLVPVNTLQLIRLREEDQEDEDEDHNQHISRGNLVVFVPNAPTPNVSVTIVVTF